MSGNIKKSPSHETTLSRVDEDAHTPSRARQNSAERRVYRTSSFNDLANVQSDEGRVVASEPDRRYVPDDADQNEKLWKLTETYLPRDSDSIQRQIVNHVEYTLARQRHNFDTRGAYQAVAHSVRDRLIESWNDSQDYFDKLNVKRVYYLSLEFLVGRSLRNAIMNLGLQDNYAEALDDLGYKLENIYEEERDAALGNGGLGRLASCFLDSIATTNLPGWGYGIRYKYGMFHQKIVNGFQVELPDYWLNEGNPWEIPRNDIHYPVRFYGNVIQTEKKGCKDEFTFEWEGGEVVQAVAYDTPIPGYDTYNTINMRLWNSRPANEFDLDSFNQGDYIKAINARQRSENITSVLYPNDNNEQGKELRLKQEYFFVSATVQDCVARFKKINGTHNWELFHEKVAMQLNDTHPAIAVAELVRVLVDEECVPWKDALRITQKTLAYTNHTVLPEALEKWSVGLMEHLLPRHMKIIYDINHTHLKEVEAKWPGDWDKLGKLSIIEEGHHKMVRMAHLAVVGSHSVNGVAAIHSEIVKERIFPDFYTLSPEKFNNKTNGVTPRRWISQCNPTLANIISQWTGSDEWVVHLDKLAALREHADNTYLHRQWTDAKFAAKQRLAEFIEKNCQLVVDPHALFDIQIKRLHEYKRQLLNILGIIYRYKQIKTLTYEQKKKWIPRVCIFGGKAAPGYYMAKRIIKLINSVADVVNKDPLVGHLLKVVYIPNYNVSLAELMVPASDISEHISTAGTEASGTSNMKFTMNGGLIIGTMDGANIEIGEEIGFENMFIFGARAEEVDDIRMKNRFHNPATDPRLQTVFDMILNNEFGPADEFRPIIDSLQGAGDFYILGHDFGSYLEAQRQVDDDYRDKATWTRKSIMATAGSGKFSSDRTILQYAHEVWNVKPCRMDPPSAFGSK